LVSPAKDFYLEGSQVNLRGLLEFLRQGVTASDIFDRIQEELLGRLVRPPTNDWEAGYNEGLADARRVVMRERRSQKPSVSPY
jgi:hypothetical protein